MDNALSLGDMRKFKFQKVALIKSVNFSSKKVLHSDLEDLKVLMDLRKTSTLFKTEARKKIERTLKRLGVKPLETWSK